MQFSYSISFEHDLQPPDTWRGEVDAPNFEDGIRRAVFRAFSARSKNTWRPRSVVVVLEDFGASAKKTVNKTAGPSAVPPAPEPF